MTASGIDRLARELRGLAAGFVGLVLVLACATAPASEEAAPQSAAMSLSEVRVSQDASTTVIGLYGAIAPSFEDFRQDQPARIVVDLDGVAPGSVPATTAVYDGTIEEISVAAVEAEAGAPRTRVELSLAKASDYQVIALDDHVEVRVTPQATTAAEAVPAAAPATVPSGPPATRLAGVQGGVEGAGTVIRLQADGPIANAEHFPLADPERLVVDLPGVANAAAAKTEVGTSQVKRVRVGAHEGKVRVVIDGTGAGSLKEAALVPTADGLAIAFPGATLAQSATAGPSPAVRYLDETDLNTENGLQKDSIGRAIPLGRGRWHNPGSPVSRFGLSYGDDKKLWRRLRGPTDRHPKHRTRTAADARNRRA